MKLLHVLVFTAFCGRTLWQTAQALSPAPELLKQRIEGVIRLEHETRAEAGARRLADVLRAAVCAYVAYIFFHLI